MKTIALVSLLAAQSALAASVFSIYGTDTRKDLYQVASPQVRRLADSSVALFKSWDLGATGSDGKKPVHSTTLKKAKNLCDGEPFADQPTAPYCSGSLVAPDIVMTAGHCAKNGLVCLGIRIAFGYSVASSGVMPDGLAESDIYKCKKIIHSQDADGKPDFALIRLDRPVKGHVPLELDRKAALKPGDAVLAIGYPSGLPLKVADGANVRSIDQDSFVSNLDTFERNSGSPVFNASTSLVEGVLVDGDDDYEQKPGAGCMQARRCASDGCSGEGATAVSAIVPFLDEALLKN